MRFAPSYGMRQFTTIVFATLLTVLTAISGCGGKASSISPPAVSPSTPGAESSQAAESTKGPVSSLTSEPFSREKVLSALDGLQLKNYGPNCWNAALLSTGLVRATRPVSKPEYWFWMDSKYCRALSPNEELKTGDLGSFFWQAWGNYHSFMRIDNDRVFFKGSPDEKYAYKFGTYEEMFFPQKRAVAAGCKGKESDLLKKNCEFQVVYHRCSPLPADFYSKDSEIETLNRAIEPHEKYMTEWFKKEYVSPNPELEGHLDALATLLHRLRAITYSGEKEFARKSLEWRVIGLLLIVYPNRQMSQNAQKGLEEADDIQSKERASVPAVPQEVRRGNKQSK